MGKSDSWSTPDSRHRSRTLRRRRILVIRIAVIAGALLVSWIAQSQLHDDPVSVPGTAPDASPTPEPICRADGEFVAGFMSPQTDDQQTGELLQRMNTDAITFGGRVEPVDTDQYPADVAEQIGDRQAYEYTVEMNWEGIDLDDSDTLVQVDDTEYGLIAAGDNSVVVTESVNGGDPFHSLTRVSDERDNNAFIGLPVPQMRTTDETWLPDSNYADVLDGFAEKFVAAYETRGADGYYLAMEMPLTDTTHWDPVADYYDRQTQLINTVSPGATVVISPYLEGRAGRETISPETTALGYENLLGLANGTHMLVSPQDGLGVDTTALEADESGEHRYTTEDYFAALHEVDPERLYVTIEAMTPGDGTPDTREETSRERAEAQLDATDPYVQGGIGFQWAGPNAMMHIPHIGDGACAAGPGELE
ncbi:hypothetical protein GCM10009720_28220 [Yaniella flava]|uniref:DUF4434 domain-containing protein n=1 Tax=Yaniella flava TaxID=287930 RepID=A0ABN2UXR1_9MICC